MKQKMLTIISSTVMSIPTKDSSCLGKHPLSVEALLFRESGLSDNYNFLLLQAVQQYIKDKGRFAR